MAAVRDAELGPPKYVITGRFRDEPDGGEDDFLTARLIERARTGRPLNATATADAVARSPEAARTLAVGDGHVHPDDISYATAVDRFDFAMEVERVDGGLRLVRRDTHHRSSAELWPDLQPAVPDTRLEH